MENSAQRKAEDEIAQEVIKMHQRMRSKRANYEAHCQEIAERIWPSHSRLFLNQGSERTTGEKRNDYMFDATAAQALDKYTSILDSWLTPANQTWHRLAPTDPYLLKDRQTALFYEELNRMLFKARYAAYSGFIAQNQLVYKMMGAYGNGTLFPDDYRTLRGEKKGIRYRHIHTSEICLGENHQGLIDSACRYWMMDARQAYQDFGDALPDEIKSAVKSAPDKQFAFIHCVKPRRDYDPERADFKGMPFASYYVSEQGKKLLSEGGYDTFPYPTARHEQVPGEVEARSPAMMILPAIKTLNEQKKTLLTQGHRAVAPVLLTHDDGIIDTFSLRPGALNSGGVNADGRPLVHALPVGNVAIGKEMMDDERADIKESFLVNLFQILVESPQMTATEVMERAREKGILTAPAMGRVYSEYHSGLVDREISILARQKRLPEIPPAMMEAGADYETKFESPMTRTQRAEEAAGIMRVVDTAINIATNTQNPAPLDHFNWDEIVPDICEINGVPQKWLNSKESIASIRQGRQQSTQEDKAVAAAPSAAAMMKATAVAQKTQREVA